MTKKDTYTIREVQRMQLDRARQIAARGIRSGGDFKFLRKIADLRAWEIAKLLGVTAETISRWENGRQPIPKAVAFTVGELIDQPSITRRRLTKISAVPATPR